MGYKQDDYSDASIGMITFISVITIFIFVSSIFLSFYKMVMNPYVQRWAFSKMDKIKERQENSKEPQTKKGKLMGFLK